MAVISTALGILSALASAGGALAGAKANKQAERDLLAQRSDIDRELYTGALDSVGAQALLKETRRVNEKNLQGIDNGITAGGATAENALAQKQRLNEAYDTNVNNLLQDKEATKRGYFRDRMQLTGAINAGRAQQAQNWMNLASNVASAGATLGEAYLDNPEKPYLSESEEATLKDIQNDEMAKANQNLSAKMDASLPQPDNTAINGEMTTGDFMKKKAVDTHPIIGLNGSSDAEELRKKNILGQNG